MRVDEFLENTRSQEVVTVERDVSVPGPQARALLASGRPIALTEYLSHPDRRTERRTFATATSWGEGSLQLGLLQGTERLMASLLYGSGLRLLECVKLRVKDIDFRMGQVLVRRGKGKRDRVTVASRCFPRLFARRSRSTWLRSRGSMSGISQGGGASWSFLMRSA